MDYVLNIARMMSQATAQEWNAGSLWYPAANRVARDIATFIGSKVDRAAYALAALSPRAAWNVNVETAWAVANIVAGGGTCADVEALHSRITRVNRRKAWVILTTGDLDAIGNGPKTRAFADNILRPWHSEAVTIDSWAYRIAANLIGVTDEFTVNLRGKVYDDLAAAYTAVSDRWGLLPLTVQAITWVTAHRIEGKP